MADLKPNKTFVLSKQTKRLMCSILNTDQRNQFKRMMIQAELAAAIVPKSTKGDRNGGDKRPGGSFANPAPAAE